MHYDEEIQCKSPEIRETANTAISNLLPIKSTDRYETIYGKFITWAKPENIKIIQKIV